MRRTAKDDHRDKVAVVLGRKEIRDAYPKHISHVVSEKSGQELFNVLWEPNKLILTVLGTLSLKEERRAWLLALADAIEAFWEGKK